MSKIPVYVFALCATFASVAATAQTTAKPLSAAQPTIVQNTNNQIGTVNQTEAKISTLEAKIGTLEAKIASLEAKLNDQQTQVTKLQTHKHDVTTSFNFSSMPVADAYGKNQTVPIILDNTFGHPSGVTSTPKY